MLPDQMHLVAEYDVSVRPLGHDAIEDRNGVIKASADLCNHFGRVAANVQDFDLEARRIERRLNSAWLERRRSRGYRARRRRAAQPLSEPGKRERATARQTSERNESSSLSLHEHVRQ